MGRPRSKEQSWLPPYVYQRGKWLYLYEYVDGRLVNPKRLCPADSPRSVVWSAYEREQGTQALTLDKLCARFQESSDWHALAPATQSDYARCADVFCNSGPRGDRFGNWPVERFTPGVLTAYMDTRSKSSPSRARHELRWAKRLFRWAYGRDLMSRNIGHGVMVGTEPVRKRYVEDAELLNFQTAARKSGSPWLAPFSEIAYACRLRPSEALALTDARITAEGLECQRTKGSDDNVVKILGSLAHAIEQAQALRSQRYQARNLAVPLNPSDRYLFINKRGSRVTYSGLQTAWRTVMETWPKSKRFSPHDLKRKGISDAKGDKRKAAGHRSAQMTANYDTRRDVVMPSERRK